MAEMILNARIKSGAVIEVKLVYLGEKNYFRVEMPHGTYSNVAYLQYTSNKKYNLLISIPNSGNKLIYMDEENRKKLAESKEIQEWMCENLWVKDDLTDKYLKMISLKVGKDLEIFRDKENFSIIDCTKSSKIDFISQFCLSQMPGNCGMIVSSRALVHQDYRNLGIGKLLNKLRVMWAKQHGYSLMICTVQKTNTAQIKILDENGWKVIQQFNNSRTGNDILVYSISLKEVTDDDNRGQ